MVNLNDRAVSDLPGARPKRAGSPIDFARCVRVYGPNAKREQVVQGHVDPATRIFQSGGPLGKLVYWKRRVIAMPIETWNDIEILPVDRLEFIDHDKNECYSVLFSKAKLQGIRYDDGAGRRYGIPLDAFMVYNANGEVVQRRPHQNVWDQQPTPDDL